MILDFNKTDNFLIQGASYTRLLAEYYRYGSLCIGFDFDSTVYDFYKKGYTYDLMKKLLRDLKEIGCTLICWTANKDHAFVIKYLEEKNIPFDGVNIDGIPLPYETRKPFYSALLDDRAGLIQVYEDLKELVRVVKAGSYDRLECG